MMEDRYTLNEQLKRIELKDTLCQFCNERHSSKMEKNYFVPIFKEQDRTELIVYSSVKFSKILIGIPRCNQCYLVHQESSYKAWVISLVGFTLLTILSFLTLGIWGVFIFVPCFILSIITPIYLTDFLVIKRGILSQKDGAKKDSLVRDMVISGWSLTQPSAR